MIVGETASFNLPTSSNTYDTGFNGDWDIFIAQLNHNCSTIDLSTFIGGSAAERATDVELMPNGTMAVVGWTRSDDFPTTFAAYDRTPNGNNDIVIMELSSNGSSLLYSSRLGSSDQDTAQAMELNADRTISICGGTRSDDFPTTPGVYDRTFNGEVDVFIQDFEMAPATRPSVVQLITATAGDGQVILAWDAPLSDGGAPELTYGIYRGRLPSSANRITITPTLQYTDTNLVNGEDCSYWVSAINTAGEGESTGPVNATNTLAALRAMV